MTNGEKAAYIAAFIDGEGRIGLSQIKKTGHFTREIRTINTDKSLIDAFVGMCHDLGLPTSMYFRTRQPPEKDVWMVRISGGRKIYERFQAIIPLQAPRKRQRLQELIDSYRDRDELRSKLQKGKRILCAHCQAEFYGKRSEKRRFCSAHCSAAASIHRLAKICETCAKPYEVIQARKASKFCSLACSGKAQAQRLSELGQKTIENARRAKEAKKASFAPVPRS